MSSIATEHILRGSRNRGNGAAFEVVLDAMFNALRRRKVAHVQKTPEPMRPVSAPRNGTFQAVFTKTAQPDYQGTLNGGRSVVLEAKYTDGDRIEQKRVSEEQSAELDKHTEFGAAAGVLVCFRFERFGLVPWMAWRRMKDILGRKYITAQDVLERGWVMQHDSTGESLAARMQDL